MTESLLLTTTLKVTSYTTSLLNRYLILLYCIYDSTLNCYFLFITCFPPTSLHDIQIACFLSFFVHALDTDTFFAIMMLWNCHLLTGKVLSLSHVISNINMASEIRTLKDSSGILYIKKSKTKQNKTGGSSKEVTWPDHAISNAVTSTKLLLCCINLKKKKKKKNNNNNNKNEKCFVCF